MKKYKVTVANDTVMLLEKNWVDFWIFDNKHFKAFRKLNGRRIKLALHWILMIEEVKDWEEVRVEMGILAEEREGQKEQ